MFKIFPSRGDDNAETLARMFGDIFTQAEREAADCGPRRRATAGVATALRFGATVRILAIDRRMLRTARRLGLVSRAGRRGEWRLGREWRDPEGHPGFAIITAEVVVDLLHKAFGERIQAQAVGLKL